ncbi:MAG: 30S ribosomal protein S20, partial [Elusimicrobiota bacterium]
YLHNKSLRSRAKTYVKKILELVEESKIKQARELMPVAHKNIDKAAQKGALHKNRAARMKSRINRNINSKKS